MTTRKKTTARKSPSKKRKGVTLLKAGTDYPSSPDTAKLESFENQYADRTYWIEFDCPEFTALCPITAQPDFGTINIRYIPNDLCLESKSLKLYIFSYRNHGTFHEEVVNRICEDIVKAIHPRCLIVTGNFNPRGGIALRVQATYPEQDDVMLDADF